MRYCLIFLNVIGSLILKCQTIHKPYQVSMKLKKIQGKSLIYDSTDDMFYDNHTIELNNGDSLVFSPTDVTRLKDLEKNKKNDLLAFILKSCNSIYRFAPTPDLYGYKNEDGVLVYFKETDRYLLVASLGETQPSRYKIYVEGVFEKSPLNGPNLSI